MRSGTWGTKTPQFWALDEMVYHTEPSNMKGFHGVTGQPNEVTYTHGLFIISPKCTMEKGLLH